MVHRITFLSHNFNRKNNRSRISYSSLVSAGGLELFLSTHNFSYVITTVNEVILKKSKKFTALVKNSHSYDTVRIMMIKDNLSEIIKLYRKEIKVNKGLTPVSDILFKCFSDFDIEARAYISAYSPAYIYLPRDVLMRKNPPYPIFMSARCYRVTLIDMYEMPMEELVRLFYRTDI